MKVLFLDIDGVLNYLNWYNDDRNPGNLNGQESDLDPDCVDRIIRICDETGAKVVISSDWKLSWYGTLDRLGKFGLTEEYIIDKTPDFGNNVHVSRGYEIDAWLQCHPECTNFVIVDDRTDFTDDQHPHFIHIDRETGITDDDADIAIMTLKHH